MPGLLRRTSGAGSGQLNSRGDVIDVRTDVYRNSILIARDSSITRVRVVVLVVHGVQETLGFIASCLDSKPLLAAGMRNPVTRYTILDKPCMYRLERVVRRLEGFDDPFGTPMLAIIQGLGM
jgi:hypothetical protein